MISHAQLNITLNIVRHTWFSNSQDNIHISDKTDQVQEKFQLQHFNIFTQIFQLSDYDTKGPAIYYRRFGVPLSCKFAQCGTSYLMGHGGW